MEEINISEFPKKTKNNSPAKIGKVMDESPMHGHIIHFLSLVLLIIGFPFLFSELSRFQSIRLNAATYYASLRLPATLSVTAGEQISLPISLDTQGSNTLGVDVLISFDISKLELLSITSSSVTATNLKYFAPADSSGNFKSADVVYKANSTGVVEFSAATLDFLSQKVLPAFNGKSDLAVLNFKTKTVGTTSVNFQMVSGSTKDTNIVILQTGAPIDILSATSQITNLNLTINAISLTPTPTITPTPVVPTLTPTPGITVIPVTSTPVPTAIPSLVPTATPTPITPPSGQLVKINPIKDTYTSSGSQTTSYASSSVLYVDGSPNMVTYMIFDLRAYKSGALNNVKLSFKTTSGSYSGSPNKVEVYSVDNTDWVENVTYANKPVVSTTKLGEVLASSYNTVYGITLNNDFISGKLGGLMAIALTPTGGDALYLYSRESSIFKPQLELDFSGGGSAVSIFAAGSSADGSYSNMDLLINDVVVSSFKNVMGNISSRTFVEHRYTHPLKVTHDQVKVKFTNDLRNSSGDRDLMVDRVVVDGEVFQSESSTVYGTGVWTRSAGCTTGYLKTERLYCNGYFQY